ncbi:hypothetical protein D3C73_889300 [compost metagenome]
MHNHACPLPVYIHIIGKVDRIGHPSTGWTHINFKGNNPPILIGFEQFDMEEALFDIKSLQNVLSSQLHLRTDILKTEIVQVVVRIDNVHHAVFEQVADREPHVAVNIDQPVIGQNDTINELLNNKGDIIRLGVKKLLQLSFVMDLVGHAGPGAKVGLHHERKAGAADEIPDAVPGGAGRELHSAYTAFTKKLFHLGFLLQVVDKIRLGAVNVKIRADRSVLLQPIFIQGFEAVNFAVLMGKVAYSPQDLVVIFQAAYFVILR